MIRRLLCVLGFHSMRWCPSESVDVMVCRHCPYVREGY